MAINSTFYDTAPGEGVKETTWAQSAPSRGSLFGVVGENDFKLTAHPSTPYTVNIGPGKAWGHGVFDEVTGTTAVTCATPAKGVIRWDLMAIRRDWQPTGGGPSGFKAISGSATQTIPTTMENRPGSVADQPLYLIQWKGGETQPQKIIDLRCWPSIGGVEIADKLALSYLATPGAAPKLGSSTWRYERQANNVWDWREYVPVDPDSAPHRNGYGVVRTNPDGYCTIGYKTPFPRGTTNAIANSMDPPGGYAAFEFVKGEPHAASFRAFASDGKALGNASVGISYAAFGF